MLKNKKHSKNFSSAIVLISILGIVLGVSVMILTISVAEGFQKEIKNKLMGFGSHIQIENLQLSNSNETSPIIRLGHNIDSLEKDDNIIAFSPYILKSSIIQHSSNDQDYEIAGVVFKGVNQSSHFLQKYLTKGVIPNYSIENDSIILSRNMIKKLQINIGAKISAFFITNGKPKQRNYILAGVYETGLDKIDDQYGFIDIKQLIKLNKWGFKIKALSNFTNDSILKLDLISKSNNGEVLYALPNGEVSDKKEHYFNIKKDSSFFIIGYEIDNKVDKNLISLPDTLLININHLDKEISFDNIEGSGQFYTGGYEVSLKNYQNAPVTLETIKNHFGPEYYITSIEERFIDLFSWLNLIYQNVYIIILLMVGVAIINMSTALLVLIVEKTKMIGILKSMGISTKSLRKVFVFHGGILLFIGFAGGNVLAFSIMLLQNKYQLLSLPKENYYLDSVPMHFPMNDIIILNSIAFIVCFIAMILPSLLSARISPIKAINTEI